MVAISQHPGVQDPSPLSLRSQESKSPSPFLPPDQESEPAVPHFPGDTESGLSTSNLRPRNPSLQAPPCPEKSRPLGPRSPGAGAVGGDGRRRHPEPLPPHTGQTSPAGRAESRRDFHSVSSFLSLPSGNSITSSESGWFPAPPNVRTMSKAYDWGLGLL